MEFDGHQAEVVLREAVDYASDGNVAVEDCERSVSNEYEDGRKRWMRESSKGGQRGGNKLPGSRYEEHWAEQRVPSLLRTVLQILVWHWGMYSAI